MKPQFPSNTKKYESDSYVRGSNGIYQFQLKTGRQLNLEKEFKDYIYYKLAQNDDHKTTNSRILTDISVGFFKKPDDMPYDEFAKAVSNGNIPLIGNLNCTPYKRNYSEVDKNGNILVASKAINDDRIGTGDVLIDGQTGTIIRQSQPSTIIHPCDKFGYYPVEIYKTRNNKSNGNLEVYDKEYNFLSPKGQILCSTKNFHRVSEDCENVQIIDRNYYDRRGKNIINEWNIISPAIVCEYKSGVEMFPTAVHALLEYINREKRGEHLPNISKSKLLQLINTREDEIDEVTEKIGKRYDNGEISDIQYNSIMKTLDNEYNLFHKINSQIFTQEK